MSKIHDRDFDRRVVLDIITKSERYLYSTCTKEDAAKLFGLAIISRLIEREILNENRIRIRSTYGIS